MTIEIINPLTYPNWDDLLLTNSDYSFFHSAAWARVLSESYGYKPFYFASMEGGNLRALVPVMEVNSFLTGRRGVSLPFTDFCPPIAENKSQFKKIVEGIRGQGKKRKWRYIEWRGAGDLFEESAPSCIYYSHTLNLAPGEDALLKKFRDSTSRNIKKAAKEGVEITIDRTFNTIGQFYKLNCVTRKRHGLPPQPFCFFRKIFDHVISSGFGFLVSAVYLGRIIASAVYFHFGKKSIYKYGASDTEYQHLRPNNLVMWEAIRECVKRGFASLSLGRTQVNNRGLLQFKRGWGATEESISYYRYDLNKNRFIRERSGKKFQHKIFRFMPPSILKLSGKVLYKHAG